MALTWAQARDKVRGDLWRPGPTGVPDDVCDRALHASLLEIEGARRFSWLEDCRRTVALVAATSSFAFPTDLRSLGSLSLVRQDGKVEPPLERVTVERAKYSAAQTLSTGLPTAYALADGTIWLDAKADIGQAFDIVGFFATPDDLDAAIAAGAANVTLQTQQVAVFHGACEQVAIWMKNDAEAARRRAAFDRRLETICDRDDELREDTFGGGVQPDTAYQEMAGG